MTTKSNIATTGKVSANTVLPGIYSRSGSIISTPEFTWDSLRKHARQLEYEIDSGLVSFSKVASNPTNSTVMGTHSSLNDSTHGSTSTQPFSSSFSASQSIEQDLDNLLNQLTTTINSMSAYLEGPGSTHPSRASMTHLLHRHRSNQFEYSKEFRKTRTNILAKKEHAELLSSIHNDINPHRSGNSRDYYLSERERLEQTNTMADDIFQNAMDAHDDLGRQRSSLFGSHGRIAGILNRFPQLNNTLSRINSRKFRDTWIMGVVLGVGMCVLLLYALS
ncbi:hypothetical protein BATDEDRAFT_89985 [Batrachochytrium dendrobatidis JAM81]|uniref:Golgi SNAP receptor complex member 1 n=2 Tax=Batrachochytrium dendrobatidis TaxID=109871 RepID=F4P742_BATDJ|nr:uncharacterized protein BATDEDRAFT_89985 [Batrachochytrium dendrobatidis JAM81]EGF78799.1 hypothetical protein BATDEDRAFT_89985 [Batrachochytrium dendrobatidis JAM81]KAJ8325434.1 protein transport protein gos1 [Batrachochytrium dendrobatidis]KAK5670252.1 protein transport protein gos1 [Batrachochytrium dendrobatidis]OAJ42454.1 hypothetical protein BDEG_25905 [Batrachochytrium dendrobatidis JEL423]|eukprot:XP_006680457.1 hypothetical protein BATDEDRAFT_89985 [Batrachochytrium dendrobatidis JAM81]